MPNLACRACAPAVFTTSFLPKVTTLVLVAAAVVWPAGSAGQGFAQGKTAQEKKRSPNVVFILADDLGWADVGFHGGAAPTPHLDGLVRDGVELTQHYVAPVCSPTRAGLLTGRYWSRFGVTSPQNNRALPFDTVTLPRALKSAGYATCLTGKWHLGSAPEWGPLHYGFDHAYGSLAGGVGPWNHFYKKGPYTTTWHRDEKLIEESGHVTDLLAAEAIRWIEARGDAPYFLYVPFTAVHLPIREPEEYLRRVPASIQGEVARQYAACVLHLDDAVGRIVAAVDKSGRRDDTLIVFTSDNGGSRAENNDTQYPADDYPRGALTGDNRPLRGAKGQLYEGGIRVPTVARWPGRLKPGKYTAPAHIVDWMPTICEIAGSRPAKNLAWDGQSLWPGLSGAAAPASRSLYWVAPGWKTRAVRVGDWKLIAGEDAKRNPIQLFDLARDPHEMNDLASQSPAKVEELSAVMRQLAAADRDATPKD